MAWGIEGSEDEDIGYAAQDILLLADLTGNKLVLSFNDEKMLEILLEHGWKYKVSRGGDIISQHGIDEITRLVRERGGDARQVSRMIGRISMKLGEPSVDEVPKASQALASERPAT